ncbi:hypothetical protein [Streptomyces sp. 7N604]|uniref:hypothetical protein n=1 Tax=Streptomyces sp. 7N604 TaxID=3457415 RepID=UPI003FD30540
MTALQLRQKTQEATKQAARELWTKSGFVFTTRYGTPIDPRNFNREFAARSVKAGVRKIQRGEQRSAGVPSTHTFRPRRHARRCGSSASTSTGKIETSCCTSLLYGTTEPLPDISVRGFELLWT